MNPSKSTNVFVCTRVQESIQILNIWIFINCSANSFQPNNNNSNAFNKSNYFLFTIVHLYSIYLSDNWNLFVGNDHTFVRMCSFVICCYSTRFFDDCKYQVEEKYLKQIVWQTNTQFPIVFGWSLLFFHQQLQKQCAYCFTRCRHTFECEGWRHKSLYIILRMQTKQFNEIVVKQKISIEFIQ